MNPAQWDQQLFSLLHPPLLHLLGEQAWRWTTSLALPLSLLLITSSWGWHQRRSVMPLLLALGNGLFAEQLSSRLLKPLIGRPRPCSVEELSSLSSCTGGLSMPSSHAISICAGLSVLWFYYPRLRPLYVLGAALFVLSRLALGVHYPADLLVGSLLGIGLGLVVRKWLTQPTWAQP